MNKHGAEGPTDVHGCIFIRHFQTALQTKEAAQTDAGIRNLYWFLSQQLTLLTASWYSSIFRTFGYCTGHEREDMHAQQLYVPKVTGLTFSMLAVNLSIRFNSPSRIHDILPEFVFPQRSKNMQIYFKFGWQQTSIKHSGNKEYTATCKSRERKKITQWAANANKVNNLCCHWLISRPSVTLTHETRRELGNQEAKNSSNGSTCSEGNSNSSRNYYTHADSQSTRQTTHLLPWLLAHLTDLPTHSLNADVFFRTGVKWRHDAMTTSCRRTADLQSMRRDFQVAALL